MLTRVAFQNFKALVGANATGKTSVLEGILPFDVLRDRGRSNGLADFLRQQGDALVPLLRGGSAQPS